MTDDPGGEANSEASPITAVVSPSWQMTPEEEEALLAEYGAAGPYDDIVEWTAPSQFKSQMGDGHVFLTGAIGEDDDARDVDIAVGSGCDGDSSVPQRSRKLMHKDPLRLYLHEHFPSLMLLDRRTPSSLMETVTDALDALENMRAVDGPQVNEMERRTIAPLVTGVSHFPTLERHAAVLRRGKEWVRRASLAAKGTSITAMASHLLVPDAHDTPVVSCGDGSPVKAASAVACDEDMEYHRLLESAQQLLAKATETLNAHSAPVCDSGAEETKIALRELHAREALLAEDALDDYHDRMEVLNGDDDEEEVVQLLYRARKGRSRLCKTLTLSQDDALTRDLGAEHDEEMSVLSAEDVGANGQPLCLLTPKLPYLYAFEMVLPVSQRVNAQSVPLSSCALLSTQGAVPGLPIVNLPAPELLSLPANSPNVDEKSVSVQQLLMRSAEVLTQIANTEPHDADVQRAAVATREEYVRARQHGSGASESGTETALRCDDRSARGLATLRSFVQQLDVLLSPTQEEQNYRRGAARTPSTQATNEVRLVDDVNTAQLERSGDGGSAAESVSRSKNSLERIRWKAARDSFLLDREVFEQRRMRFEDELVEREIRAAADQLAFHAEQRTGLEQSALQAVECLCHGQRAAYADILAAANKNRALAQQSQELRRLQETEKLVYTLIVEWEVQREQWLQEEALSLRMLRRDAKEEEEQARVATQRRLDGEMAAARRAMGQLRTAFEQQRVEPGWMIHQDLDGSHVADTVVFVEEMTLRGSEWYSWRIAPFRAEQIEVLRWITAQRKAMERVHGLLVEAEGHYRANLQAAVQSPSSRDTSASALVLPEHPPLEEGGLSTRQTAALARVLDTDTFAKLLWPYLHAVLRHRRRAPQYLAKLDLSLDELRLVNWDQLRHLNLNTAPAAETDHKRDEAISIPCLVKELDVSGNPLRQFDVVEAVRTFSTLQSLSVSHAELRALDTSDAIVMTSTPPETGLPEQRRASSARAASARYSHLRHVTAARNHALATQVHLVSLDVSFNNLASLTPLSTIASSSLVRCMAKANKLTGLDSLSGCVQLRELSAAHNNLTDVLAASALPLLRELDVENNDLASLFARGKGTGDEAMYNSLMLLSRLKASHNPLCALPTSQHVYPCLTHLFVNHARLTSLGASSLGWFPMLAELQAEGNEISDIGGVQHCPRLQSLRLSHNRLASLTSLEPLRCCTRLHVLDLTGNPCLVTASNDVQLVATVTRTLYELVPSLEVLNNSRRAHVRKQPQAPESHAASIGTPTTRTETDTDLGYGGRADAAPAAVAASWSRFLPCATPQLYREIFSVLCWDAQVQQLVEEKQLREADAVRLLHRPQGEEPPVFPMKTAAGEEKKGGQAQSKHCSGSVADLDRVTAAQNHVRTMEHHCRVEHYRLDAAALSEWISLCERSLPAALPVPAESDPLANKHVRNLLYEQQEQDYVKHLARAYLAEWLQGRVLVRQARLELHRLRVTYGQSEALRQELAARRIQPVWRGAALRSRLRRILHPTLAGDGEGAVVDAFTKVNVDNWLAQNASVLAPVELLFHDVVESACGIDAVPFGVSTMTSAAAASTTTGAPSSSVSTTFPPVPPRGARPHEGVVGGSFASAGSAERPPSDGVEVRKGKGGCSTLVDQWGPLVAAQIRKRQQKSSRTRQQHMRKEFLEDPLRVKRELREDHAQQRAK